MKIFRFRLFFTPAGVAALVLSLVILIRSLLASNAYEIVLSSAALFLLLCLASLGFWKSKKLVSLEAGWKTPFPMTAKSGEETVVSGLDVSIPFFFRLHFIVRGQFFPGGLPSNNSSKGCRILTETSVPRGESAVKFVMDFPMSGVFQGDGYLQLRDIFGFCSFVCGIPLSRTLKVRSAPYFGNKLQINAQTGAEDKRTRQSSDEERYYMREYTPGDRFRDINWKSSEKIDTLITRISPDNQEKVSRIEVYFRNYGPSNKPSLEALWMLDRAKARLSHFLRSLMEEQSNYIFHVRCAQDNTVWEINTGEDGSTCLEEFLDELSALSFSAPQNDPLSSSNSELYVFSTACDAGLPGFLLGCNPRPVSLFLVQPQEAKTAKAEVSETLHKVDFLAKGILPNPRWIFKKNIKRLHAIATRTENIVTETKL